MTEDFQPPTSLEASARAQGADTARYRIDYLMLAMRDGIRLATVVIRPKAAGGYPVLLARTPYPVTSVDTFGGFAKALFEKNYAIIFQNERGSQWSEGDFGLLTTTTADGQDTLDWIAAQDWSNGRVGLHGCSSTAENQLKLAATGHPALRACVAMSSGAGIGDIPGAEGTQGLFYRGGVPMLADWARCGFATATAWGARRAWRRARSTGLSCAGSPRPTTSRAATGSGSRSPGRASPTPTGTGTPAAATTWTATARSRT